MRATIAGTLALVTALSACDIPTKKAPPVEQGLGAGAATTPAPTPPVDSAAPTTQPNTAATPAPAPTAEKKPARATDQTQSGVTDKSGTSTLGQNIKKPRPDANQPVTAKGDVVRARWDSSQGGWVYSKLGDSTTIKAPGDTKGDTAFNQSKGDSMKVVSPTDSAVIRAPGAMKGDTAFNQQKGDSLKPVTPTVTPVAPAIPVTPEAKPLQGNDTMPTKPAAPTTLPEPMPAPTPAPTPAPAPAPAPTPQ